MKTVKASEYVVFRNEQTGNTNYRRVLQTTVKHTAVTVSMTLADAKSGQMVETITSSRKHPYFVEGKGFVPAGGLAIGNSIVTRAGPSLLVKAVTWNRRPEGYAVYNFVVEDDHTYFVGLVDGGAWVHNDTCDEAFQLLNPRNWVGKRQAVRGIKDVGKFDVLVNNEEKAHALLQEAHPGLPELGTYADFPTSGGFQVHPVEPGVNPLPHLKYQIGRGSSRNWGHIFFGGEE